MELDHSMGEKTGSFREIHGSLLESERIAKVIVPVRQGSVLPILRGHVESGR